MREELSFLLCCSQIFKSQFTVRVQIMSSVNLLSKEVKDRDISPNASTVTYLTSLTLRYFTLPHFKSAFVRGRFSAPSKSAPQKSEKVPPNSHSQVT